MSHKLFSRIIRLDTLIRTKSSGSPEQLANKLNISQRSVYHHISLLKKFGAPIKYSKYQGCYYYERQGSFEIGFKNNEKNI